jgi:hypothetical protein
MRLNEIHTSLSFEGEKSQRIKSFLDALLRIVGVLDEYRSGSVPVLAYERTSFAGKFRSAGHTYDWIGLEGGEEECGALYLMLAYYAALMGEVAMHADLVHRRLGHTVMTPREAFASRGRHTPPLSPYTPASLSLLWALDIIPQPQYQECTAAQLAEAWGLARICGVPFDEVLTS